MIRHRVDRSGKLFPLAPASELRCCNLPATEIGFPKAAAIKGWIAYKRKADMKYAAQRRKGNEDAPRLHLMLCL